jgi:hypothetical protein
MKKLLVLFMFIVGGMLTMNAQTAIPEVTPDFYITQPASIYVGGNTAATLTNGDTLTYVFRIKTQDLFDIKLQLYVDFVSGTAAGKLKTYKSINGIDYVVTAAGDSITATGVTADYLDTEELTFNDCMITYLKAIYIQTGTAVTKPKLMFIIRKN